MRRDEQERMDREDLANALARVDKLRTRRDELRVEIGRVTHQLRSMRAKLKESEWTLSNAEHVLSHILERVKGVPDKPA